MGSHRKSRIESSPSDLLQGNHGPRPISLQPEAASVLARRYGFRFDGPDIVVQSIGPLSSVSPDTHGRMTYLAAPEFASNLKNTRGIIVLTNPKLRDHVPSDTAVLLTEENVQDAFYTLFAQWVEEGRFESLEGRISPSARIAASAVISNNVFVDNHAVIGPGAVILPNTYVGPRVVIKANATIGGDGFETAVIKGHRRIVPHAGGVWLAEGVEVGSSTCIDKGLFGQFSYVGQDTKIDNLVHIAHAVSIGHGCSLIACCEISGSAILGDGVWLGPNTSINQRIRIGNHCYIGTGSVVTRDLHPHTLAHGSPARAAGHVCVCRNILAFEDNLACCSRCGKEFARTEQGVRHVG
jgi:UDP-3-O-[3-hydroxymyristoyl] glucosamine N-acyltransferase